MLIEQTQLIRDELIQDISPLSMGILKPGGVKTQYRGMAFRIYELAWMRNLWNHHLGFKPKEAMNLFCDNKPFNMIEQSKWK
jgi:hypothetical protein